MADTQTLNPFSTKPKEQKQEPLGGKLGFLDEIGGEFVPDPQRLVAEGGQFIKESLGAIGDAIGGLIKEDISFTQTPEQAPKASMPAKGSIEFQKNYAKSPELLAKEEEAAQQKIVYTNLEEARQATQRFAHERILADAARLEWAATPTDEKLELLHLSRDLRPEHIDDPYHMHAGRIKKMEQFRALEQQKKNTEIPSPAKQPSALEVIFEGGSGSHGGKTVNLSATGGNAAG